MKRFAIKDNAMIAIVSSIGLIAISVVVVIMSITADSPQDEFIKGSIIFCIALTVGCLLFMMITKCIRRIGIDSEGILVKDIFKKKLIKWSEVKKMDFVVRKIYLLPFAILRRKRLAVFYNGRREGKYRKIYLNTDFAEDKELFDNYFDNLENPYIAPEHMDRVQNNVVRLSRVHDFLMEKGAKAAGEI